MRARPFFYALFLPVLCTGGLAWGTDNTEPIALTAPTQKFNIANCQSEDFTFQVTFTDLRTAGTGTTYFPDGARYQLWIARGSSCDASDPDSQTEVSCENTTGDCCERLQISGSKDAAVPTLTSGVATADTDRYAMSDYLPCDKKVESTFKLIGYVQVINATTLNTEWSVKTLDVDYDFLPPDPPSGIELSAGQSEIDVSWAALSDTTVRYRAYATASEIDPSKSISDQESSLEDLQHSSETSAGETSATISGLRGQTKYNVVVVSYDEQDNESVAGNSTEITTIEETDFYQLYRGMGGKDSGGYCAVAQPGQLGIGGILPLAAGLLLAASLPRLRRRVRRGASNRKPGRRSWGRSAGPLAGALLVLLAAGTTRPAYAESPRILTMSLSFGDYQPSIDKEFNSTAGTGPYKRFFGEKSALLTRLDLGWNLFTQAGTLSLGVGGAYGTVSARTLAGAPADVAASDKTTQSITDSEMKLVPVSLSLTYAFDLLAERYSFPLVPFASGGLDYVFWWVYNGAGDVSSTTDPKGEGKGGVAGFHGSLGVRLLLDVFAPDMASTFDMDMGVNNTYLFAEYLKTEINNFGDINSLNLSSSSLFFGLAFDF